MKMNKTSPFVITISRQLGSGGAYIGQRLAKNLNFFYADREIISQAAKQFSLLVEDLESREEKTLSFWESFFQSFMYTTEVYIPPQMVAPTDRELFKAESEIIERIAQDRSAVIVGRCSSYILRKHPNHISIFLHAHPAFRKERLQKLYGVSEEAARKMITQSDKERAQYYLTFTGREWTDVRNYDISIDTGKTGLEKCEALIMKYLELI
jgi:CMP/dCMP kinase